MLNAAVIASGNDHRANSKEARFFKPRLVAIWQIERTDWYIAKRAKPVQLKAISVKVRRHCFNNLHTTMGLDACQRHCGGAAAGNNTAKTATNLWFAKISQRN